MESHKTEMTNIHVTTTKVSDLSALVVDFSEHIRALVSMHLTNIGLKEVHQAGDGMAAIEKYRQVRPSIVFTDYILPKMNGLSLIKQLRQVNPQARIIMLTAVSSIEIVRLAKELGASYYILKPWQATKLSEVIANIFNLQGARQ